ncbi:hypothetical protein Droror1_Dr00016781 [Drosera rotundifolia]
MSLAIISSTAHTKRDAEQRFGGEKSQSQRRFASASTMEDIFVFDSAAVPPPPGKRKGDAARAGARIRGALEDISNAQVKPSQLNRGEKERPGLAIIANEQNQVDLLLKEKAVLKKEIADRDKLVELSMIKLQKLQMELQQLRLQNSLFAQEKSQMSAELRAGNDKLKVLEHELRCVRNVLLTRNLEFQEIMKARRLHQQTSARMEVTECQETGESLQVDKDDNNKPCSPKEIDQSKVPETSTVKHVQTKEKIGNRRRQSSRFKVEELESTKDVVKATEEHKPVERRLSLGRQSLCLKTEQVESNKGKLDMYGSVLPECPVQIDAEFPVCPEPNEGKHDDILITSASTVPETDIVEANIYACSSASGSIDLVGRPTRRAAQNVQSYKETRINSKMRRPD